ncbi:MAG: UDP-2,3-diacylglucosamine diphosphatase, partial [Gemmatimonadota bacterium]|nr:UDP-2,3-diacylglucosamine diphosphatase [Gemmatimonadota bacterium]
MGIELPPYIEAGIGRGERVLFFSDAHLEMGKTPKMLERAARVERFLDYARSDADVLVILGDLFDFYFEYKTVIPARYFRVMAGIESCTRAQVRCYYVAGNHDFWLGELFSSTLGITIAKDSLLLTRETEPMERVLAAHGDGLGEGDTGYKILKSILRNHVCISLFRLVHPDWGHAIARFTSRTSRKYTSRRQKNRAVASAQTARTLLESDNRLDAVILAHTHYPEDMHFVSGRYLNTGDWLNHFS